MDLARQLQRYRAEHHLTVRELAVRLGLPEQNVWRLLHSASAPGVLEEAEAEAALRALNRLAFADVGPGPACSPS